MWGNHAIKKASTNKKVFHWRRRLLFLRDVAAAAGKLLLSRAIKISASAAHYKAREGGPRAYVYHTTKEKGKFSLLTPHKKVVFAAQGQIIGLFSDCSGVQYSSAI